MGACERFVALCRAGRLVEAQNLAAAIKDDSLLATHRDNEGAGALLHACEMGHGKVAIWLIHTLGACLGMADEQGVTPFVAACAQGHTRLVKCLLDQCQSELAKCVLAWQTDLNGMSGLWVASHNGWLPLVQLLCSLPGGRLLAHHVDHSGVSCLHAAVRGGHLPVVEYLMAAHGCSPSQADRNGVQPVHTALAQRRMNLAQLLYKHHDLHTRFWTASDPYLKPASQPFVQCLLLCAAKRHLRLPMELWLIIFAFWRAKDCCWLSPS